jgi:dihydrofolate synthase/folylpolyglutamate synthase
MPPPTRRRVPDLLARLFALERFGIRPGLETITRLCTALGDPQRSFTSLHVAGTNGKGSVAAMVHAALVASGIRAARYTSPHLVDLAERFVIGATPVDPSALEDAAGDVLDCAEALLAQGELPAPATFFEATTALAFELFRRANVEIAVIEVGLGGRFDATNVVEAAVGAITSIGLDHQRQLGDTLEAIALEKAGIIKPGMTLVTGRLPDAARSAIAGVAATRVARLVDATADVEVGCELDDGLTRLTVATATDRYGPLTLALRGAHQVDNALVAIGLLEAARDLDLSVPATAVEHGLSGTTWPGRLERLVLRTGQRVLLDAAHNVDGARALAAYLSRWHPERPSLVLGVMEDKDVDGILDALVPMVSGIVATAVPSPRALSARALADRATARTRGGPHRAVSVACEPDPLHALDRALSSAETACVAGSIFLVGAVRDHLRHRAILP